jgi:hypothetical protein
MNPKPQFRYLRFRLVWWSFRWIALGDILMRLAAFSSPGAGHWRSDVSDNMKKKRESEAV